MLTKSTPEFVYSATSEMNSNSFLTAFFLGRRYDSAKQIFDLPYFYKGVLWNFDGTLVR